MPSPLLDQLPKEREAFWARPKPRDQGDKETAQIYLWVGRLLTQWELLEGYFAAWFQLLVESKTRAAGRAYGSIMSSHGRRQALREAAAVFFVAKKVADDDQKRFSRMLEHFALAAKRRDEIAHGCASHFELGDGDHGVFLSPPEYNSTFTDLADIGFGKWDVARHHDYRYMSADLDEIGRKISALRDAVKEYLFAFQSKYAPRGKAADA